jgi:hypothetical protein
MPSIIITITPEGSTTVDAQGYNGHGCSDATKAIERALGKTVKDTKKPEYLQSATAKASQNVRQR